MHPIVATRSASRESYRAGIMLNLTAEGAETLGIERERSRKALVIDDRIGVAMIDQQVDAARDQL